MKGRSKRLLSVLLCAVMFILTACGGNSSGGGDTKEGKNVSTKGKGRYLETDAALPKGVEDVTSIRKLEDDTIRMTTNAGIFDSKDNGKTFEKSSFQHEIKEMRSETDYLSQIQIDSKGRLILSYSSGIVRVELDGTEKEIPIDLPKVENLDGEEFSISKEVTEEGTTDDGGTDDGATENGATDEGGTENGAVEGGSPESGTKAALDEEVIMMPAGESTGLPEGAAAETSDGTSVMMSEGTPDTSNASDAAGTGGDIIIPNTENILLEVRVTQDDKILGTDVAGTLYLIDPDKGEILNKWDSSIEFSSASEVVGKRLVQASGNGIDVYDIETGKLQDPEPAFQEYFGESKESDEINMEMFSAKIVGGNDENTMFYSDATGLYRYTFGAGKMERVINGELCSLGNPQFVASQIVEKADGGFLILYSGDRNNVLKDYSYSKEASTVPEKELKVYVLKESQAIQQAISGFQAKHPDYYVSLEVGMSGEDAVTEEDAIKKLNTDLLSGKGPDILITDGLPLASYIEKGVLEDLTDTIEKVEEKNTFFKNVLHANKGKDGTYVVPTRFTIPVLVGDKESIEGVKDLNGLAAAAEKVRAENPDVQSVLGPYNGEVLADLLLGLSLDAIWKSDQTLDEKALTAYIDVAKEIYQANGEQEESGAVEDAIMSFNGGKNIVHQQSAGMGVIEMLSGKQKLVAGYLQGMSDAAQVIGANQQTGGTYKPLDGLSKQVFVPMDTIAINAKSGDMTGAKAFLEYMLTKEVQSSRYLAGFPVNKDALDQSYEEMKEETMVMSLMEEDGTQVALEINMGTQEDYNQLVSYLDAAATQSTGDILIRNEITKIVGECMNNQSDTKETVEKIQKSVGLHLSE